MRSSRVIQGHLTREPVVTMHGKCHDVDRNRRRGTEVPKCAQSCTRAHGLCPLPGGSHQHSSHHDRLRARSVPAPANGCSCFGSLDPQNTSMGRKLRLGDVKLPGSGPTDLRLKPGSCPIPCSATLVKEQTISFFPSAADRTHFLPSIRCSK